MILNIDDDVAEEVARDIGSDDPQDIQKALGLLWTELGNPTEMIEDVEPEVAAR